MMSLSIPSQLGGIDEVIAEKMTIGGVDLSITCLAIGNPHAVAIMDQPVEDFPLLEVGPLVENHPMFPQRINFEIVNVHSRDRIRARIFERGAGGDVVILELEAQHQHSHAANSDWIDDAVDVVVDGGVLRISWDENDEAYLEGPAVEVFTGVLERVTTEIQEKPRFKSEKTCQN